MKNPIKRFFTYYFPAIAYFILIFFLFRGALEIKRDYNTYSLRYSDEPLTVSAVANARVVLNNPKKTFTFTATFWANQNKLTVTAPTTKKTSETRAMLVNGDASTALPVYFLYGDYPSIEDKTGVAISDELAWTLWGGTNQVGEQVEWNGQKYNVRGVFKSDEPMMLVQLDVIALVANQNQSQSQSGEEPQEGFVFQGLELSGEVNGNESQIIEDYLNEIGIMKPETIINLRTMHTLANAMAWLPVFILIVWFLAKMFEHIRKTGFWAKQLVVFVVVFAVALLLPNLMNQLPTWMIPTKWSNMEHWSQIFKEMGTRFNNTLLLVPSLKDLLLKKQILAQICLMIPALFAITAMAGKWGRRVNEMLVCFVPLEEDIIASKAGKIKKRLESLRLEESSFHKKEIAENKVKLVGENSDVTKLEEEKPQAESLKKEKQKKARKKKVTEKEPIFVDLQEEEPLLDDLSEETQEDIIDRDKQ